MLWPVTQAQHYTKQHISKRDVFFYKVRMSSLVLTWCACQAGPWFQHVRKYSLGWLRSQVLALPVRIKHRSVPRLPHALRNCSAEGTALRTYLWSRPSYCTKIEAAGAESKWPFRWRSHLLWELVEAGSKQGCSSGWRPCIGRVAL